MIFPAEVDLNIIDSIEESSIMEVLKPKGDALRASIDTSMFKGTRYSSVN
mgnify:CR=1 FL=1|jgi:hypothetical protein